ncbi:c-type cytochrome [Roseovarius aestuarii]|uniref:Cytochrome c domain-containing protein n=1 Tax=Roseovarius aestuarii TaxID=475083 RepID=A0A1X7BTZ3_9RHOB|nr:cytochrome c [Roseovarius aestuarii]SMC13078.1 hypothetical protein ROA7745_02912 [Roseovarius aestuarii]
MNKVVAFLCCASTAWASEAPTDGSALKRLVHQDCGSCHGLTLKGGLGPDIRPEALQHYDAQTLSLVIMDGVEGTAMPAWRPLLTTSEIDWMVDYLLTGGE